MAAPPTIFCMSITPFTPDDQIDVDAYRIHLQRMVDERLGVYLGSPGSGEGNVLSLREMRQLYETGVEVCKGKVPVHANPRETRTGAAMLEGVKEAVAAGVDVVEIYVLDGGHGYQPTYAEQERYYRDLLEHVDHPVALSGHLLAGYLPPVELIHKLCGEYKQIVAFHANTPIDYLVEMKSALGDRITYYTRIGSFVEGLVLGASGCQAGEANVIARTLRRVLDSYLAGDMDACGADWELVKNFSAKMGAWRRGGASTLKMAMDVLDLPSANEGRVRLPYLKPPDDDFVRMRAMLGDLGVPKSEGIPA